MKYRIEYHMNRGNFIERIVDSKEEMDSIVSDFSRTSKGIESWEISAGERVAKVHVPREAVAFLLTEVAEESEEEAE